MFDLRGALHIGQAPSFVWNVLALCFLFGTAAGVVWLLRQPPTTPPQPPPTTYIPRQPPTTPPQPPPTTYIPPQPPPPRTTTEIIQPAFPTAECAGAYSTIWTGDSWVCRFSNGKVFVRKGATVTKRWD
jgi:hypothetical protein